MAIKLVDEYVNVTPANADYPGGSFKNSSTGVSLDGTPGEKKWVNDWLGFFQSLLAATGVIPSGVPDTVVASDYLTALWILIRTQATTTVRGAVELATNAEVHSGTDTVRAITPSGLRVELLTRSFISAPLTWVINVIIPVSHGLGVAPRHVGLIARCKVAELGYIVDDWVYNIGYRDGNGDGSTPTSLGANATTIFWATGDIRPYITIRTAGALADIAPMTTAKWDFYLTADL